jgi:GNAT superfamily N-acetyltransferase
MLSAFVKSSRVRLRLQLSIWPGLKPWRREVRLLESTLALWQHMKLDISSVRVMRFDPNIHKAQADSFDCGDQDLNDFLRHDAEKYQTELLSHTDLALLDDRIVGYITLLSDSIVLKTPEKKSVLDKLSDQHRSIYAFPALKIGRLAVQTEYQHSGIGKWLLEHAIGTAVQMNFDLAVGCRFITLDAYPSAMGWYEKNGFVLNKNYKDPARTHPSMRNDILN